MASTSRQFLRAASRTTARGTFSTSARTAGRRFYSSEAPKAELPKPASGGSSWIWLAGGAAAVGGLGLWYTQQGPAKLTKPEFKDYQAVYDEVAKLLQEKDDYEDGSYGPVLVRLAWHASGTYDKETGTGGSNGATMRFAPEGDHGANAGLKTARDFLEPVKAKFPWITHSDLWILSGVCAIQEMLGPKVPFRPGRSDKDMAACTPDGRLPDATQGADHLRNIFYRMGFNDQEIVALSGGHALGRCHTDRSGFDGPWTFSPTVLTNDFYKLLLEEKWDWKKWNGPKQVRERRPCERTEERKQNEIADTCHLFSPHLAVRRQEDQDPDDAAHRHGAHPGQAVPAVGQEVRCRQRPVLQGLLQRRPQAL
ncbi:hypothetical protein RB600_000164 [Gaeumannomyces tritici]